MAQLLLISTATKKTTNAIGDVVGIFPDDHKFNEKELSRFTVVKVDNSEIEKAVPEKRMMIFDTDETWKAVDKRPLYELNYNNQNKTIAHNYKGSVVKSLDDVTKEITDKKTMRRTNGR